MSGYSDGRNIYSDTTNVKTALSQGLLKVSIVGNQEFYECQVCQSSMAGSVPAEAHLQGSRHFKALRNHSYSSSLNVAISNVRTSESSATGTSSQQATNIGLPTSSDCRSELLQDAMKRKIVTVTEVNGMNHMTCNLCNVTCTGDVPMTQHLKGDQHHKRQRKMEVPVEDVYDTDFPFTAQTTVKNEKSCDVSSSYAGPQGTSVNSGDPVGSAISERIVICETEGGVETLTCQVCHKSCTGIVPMQQHLASHTHIRKVRLLNSVILLSFFPGRA